MFELFLPQTPLRTLRHGGILYIFLSQRRQDRQELQCLSCSYPKHLCVFCALARKQDARPSVQAVCPGWPGGSCDEYVVRVDPLLLHSCYLPAHLFASSRFVNTLTSQLDLPKKAANSCAICVILWSGFIKIAFFRYGLALSAARC